MRNGKEIKAAGLRSIEKKANLSQIISSSTTVIAA
jgi:hypothetical protein